MSLLNKNFNIFLLTALLAVAAVGGYPRQNNPGIVAVSRYSAHNKESVDLEEGAGQTGWFLLPCKQITVKDNLRFIFFRDRSSTTTVIKIFIKGGKSCEPEGKRGLAVITSGLSIAVPDAAQTGKLMELGAIFSSQVNEDYSVITIKCLSKNLRETLRILTGVMKKPLFSTLRINNIKKNLESRQKSEQEDPGQLSELIVRNTFFPGSGYAGSIYGDSDSLKNIKKKDVVDFYKKYVNTANMTLSVCSDMDDAQIKRIINAHFSGFPAGEAGRAEPVSVSIPVRDKRVATVVKDRKQTLTCFAFLLPRITPDHFALAFLLEDFLGKGAGSRLWRLRSVHELAYGLDASLTQLRDAGILKIYVKTGSKKKERAYQLLKKFVTGLRGDGIGAAELETAKVHAKAEFLRMNETKENRALHHGYFEILGLRSGFVHDFFSQVDQITLEQINDYIKKVFAPANMLEIRIGPGV
ncbi:M16 family metallopeptidase [Acidobacteriota bacterium]